METTSLEKIKELLDRKPPRENKREQLFWLVDVVYACKQSGSEALAQDAAEVEEALGSLQKLIGEEDTVALRNAASVVESFIHKLRTTLTYQG